MHISHDELRYSGVAPDKSPSDPEEVQRLLAIRAGEMQTYIAEWLGIDVDDDPVSFTQQEFSDWYDPQLPVFAVDTAANFAGASLLGYAAHLAERKPANVLFFAGIENGLELTEEGLVAHRGIITLADGRTRYGELAEPIPIALVETGDPVLLCDLSEAGVSTVLEPEVQRAAADKRRLSELVPAGTVRLPRRFSLDEAAAFERPVVVKPSRDAGGLGVLLGDESTTGEHLRQTYDFLEQYGYEPLLEERIFSYPIYDPGSGRRLDWNVRALISDGQVLNMYVRADAWGNPVNKARGAAAIMQKDFRRYTASPGEAEMLLARLSQAAAEIAGKLNKGVMGLDLTVDESGDVYLFEVNAGDAGGLQTIISAGGSDEYLTELQTILQSWAGRAANAVRRPKDAAYLGSLAVSEAARLDTLHHLGYDVPEEEQRGQVDRFTAFITLLEEYREARHSLQASKQERIEQRLIDKYPLELRSQLPVLVRNSVHPQKFAEPVRKIAALYPNETEWQLCRTMIGIRALDLELARNAYQAMGLDPQLPGLRTLTDMVYEEFTNGLQDVPSDDAVESLLDASVASYTDGYDAAMALLHGLEAESSMEDQVALHHFRFMLSVAAGKYDEARQAYDALERLGRTESLSDVFQEPNFAAAIARTRQGTVFFSSLGR